MPLPPPGTQAFSITRFRGAAATDRQDTLAVEAPLEIALRHGGRRRVVAVTMRTPGQDLDLAYGFLFTEGLLPPGRDLGAGPQVPGNSVELEWPSDLPLDLQSIDRHSYTSSSCGVCGKTSIEQVFQALPFPDDTARMGVLLGVLYTLPDRLRAAQELFGHTGGIHAAGLFTPEGELLHLAEDVGRHNALDKLVGHFYRLDTLPLHGTVLLLSGRASFELLQKAAMAGIAFVASVGAPSTLAVELAEDQGITLCGFLRDEQVNCYTHPQRVVVNSADK